MECEYCGSTSVPEGETFCQTQGGKVTEPCVACEECLCGNCRQCEKHCECNESESSEENDDQEEEEDSE